MVDLTPYKSHIKAASEKAYNAPVEIVSVGVLVIGKNPNKSIFGIQGLKKI